jgi:GNAT superfamily N-acetyltransferase
MLSSNSSRHARWQGAFVIVSQNNVIFSNRIPVQYEVSTDPARFDVDLIHSFLSSTYWATGMPRKVLEKSIRHALCFGVFADGKQVAFARVITDYATFAYLSDLFVISGHRGRGVSKLLVRSILDHPELQGLRRFVLATKDAHGLYAQFGFEPLSNPEDFMTIHNPDVYKQASNA